MSSATFTKPVTIAGSMSICSGTVNSLSGISTMKQSSSVDLLICVGGNCPVHRQPNWSKFVSLGIKDLTPISDWSYAARYNFARGMKMK